MTWRTEWVDDADAFRRLEAPWDALAAGGRPWDRHAWFTSWWDAFGAGGRLAVLTVWDGDELAAALPAVRRRRVLDAMANVHTPVLRPLARDDEARVRLVAALGSAPWSALHLDALEAGTPELAALTADAHGAGRLVVVEPRHVSPIVHVDGGIDAWRAATKKALDHTVKRRKRMRRDYEVDSQVLVLPERFDELVEEGLRLEASGWKGAEGTAILSHPATARFYRTVARRLAELDLLRLSALRMDGRLVGFDLGAADGSAYGVLKTAYDEEERKLSPGLVLRLDLVERCFELGIDHDFLGDDLPHKRLFSNGERRHVMLRVHRRDPEGAARFAWRAAGRPAAKRAKARLATMRRG